MEVAWQAHFVTNMFIRPKNQEEFDQEPDFVVYNASKAKVENYKEPRASFRDSRPLQRNIERAGHPQHLVWRRDEEGHVLYDELFPST